MQGRVGGAAQTKIIKKLGGGIRLALAQYRELAAFSQFASDLDVTTRKQLERGQRVTEIMKQNQYNPLTISHIALSLFAVDNGYLDSVEIKHVVSFEKKLHLFMENNFSSVMDEINKFCKIDHRIFKLLSECLNKFKEY